MTNTNSPPTPTAKPRGVSMYDPQWDHAKERADELTKKNGKKVSASEYIQMLVDKDMKKHKNTKPQ